MSQCGTSSTDNSSNNDNHTSNIPGVSTNFARSLTLQWWQVISAGWTLSPLQPEYLEGGRPSHQCLVTLVLKLDLGGWLTSSSGGLMAALLQPIMLTFLGTSVRNAFLQPLMMSVISLRDKVPPCPPLSPLHDVCHQPQRQGNGFWQLMQAICSCASGDKSMSKSIATQGSAKRGEGGRGVGADLWEGCFSRVACI